MPKRPREHQLEEESIMAFKDWVPKHWVVRDKSHDYGIDLEVEIWGEDNLSTGAIFYVQLKATDSKKEKEQKSYQFKIDTLEYYDSFDLPVLIARYSSQKKEINFKWAHEVFTGGTPPGQKTVKINFSPNYKGQEFSANNIKLTVFAWRELNKLTSRSKIPIFCEFETSGHASVVLKLRRILRKEIGKLTLIRYINTSKHEGFCLRVQIEDDKIFLHFDSLLPTTIEIREDFDNYFISDFFNSICSVLYRARLFEQAKEIAIYLLKNNITNDNRHLASLAASSLASIPKLAVDLAILNNLHTEMDPFFMIFVSEYFASEKNPERGKELRRFYSEGLRYQGENGHPEVKAAFYYSMANNFRNEGDFLGAVSYFNKARRQDPSYLERDYFCSELGMCFFNRKKFKWARRAYTQANLLKPSLEKNFFLGDSLFFCGEFKKALKQFKKIEVPSGGTRGFEAHLKLNLISWLIERTAQEKYERKTTEANLIVNRIVEWENKKTEKILEEVLLKKDPLNGLGAFNLALHYIKQKKYLDALMLFLIQAFSNHKDGEAWANVIACVLNEKTIPTDFFISCLFTSLTLGENYFLEELDKLISKNELSEKQITILYKALDEVQKIIDQNKKEEGVIFRVSGEKFAEIMKSN